MLINKQCIKLELSRALKSGGMQLGICIGCILTAMQFWKFGIELAGFNRDESFGMYTLYDSWIGGEESSAYPTLYYTVVPILCTLPFSVSFYEDLKSGYVKNILSRVKFSHYFVSKYIATFISGGLVIVIPMLFNLFLSATILPAMTPEVTGATIMRGRSWMADLFFTTPLLYVAFYMCVIFCLAGAYATIPLLAAWFVDNKYIVQIVPFAIIFAFNTFILKTPYLFWNQEMVLSPAQPYLGMEWYVPFTSIILIASITFIGFLFIGRRSEYTNI